MYDEQVTWASVVASSSGSSRLPCVCIFMSEYLSIGSGLWSVVWSEEFSGFMSVNSCIGSLLWSVECGRWNKWKKFGETFLYIKKTIVAIVYSHSLTYPLNYIYTYLLVYKWKK